MKLEKLRKLFLLPFAFVAFLAPLTLTGCPDDDGAEEVGEEIDDATDG